LVLSPSILAEIGRTLLYEKLQKFQWMSKTEIIAPLEGLAEESLAARRSGPMPSASS
jgi:hypothetical protein